MGRHQARNLVAVASVDRVIIKTVTVVITCDTDAYWCTAPRCFVRQ